MYLSLFLSVCVCVCVFVCVCLCVCQVSMAWHVSLICFKDLQARFNAETAKTHCGKPMPHVCKHNCNKETQLFSKAVRLLSPRYVCMQINHIRPSGNASPNLLNLLLCDSILVEEEVKNLTRKEGHKSPVV